MTQLHFFLSLACAEFVSLTVMAFDHYVAICYPLRYCIVMNRSVCFLSVIASWTFSFSTTLTHTLLISHLPFLASYTYIISTIGKICSTVGKKLSLLVPPILLCNVPLYTALIPLINPFIYTLRNKDFKQHIARKIMKLIGIIIIVLKKDINKHERVQSCATKLVKGMEELNYEERLQLFPLEKKHLQGNTLYNTLENIIDR
ncbi:hypothetical protein XELAEV_18040214mg [Xenopus laevis]|uniref:G-protein coupled receptors family 1 profile domain-containing protein n=1 Tax=Xenopus laevis TaxID=8355 RepID=A0A974C971_XENLA|nr:hypothetical protein XELAEV_18040214mg [Xenopus laevis]